MRVTKHHEIVLKVPPEDAWRVVQDIPSLVDCLPGAQVVGRSESGAYDGQIKVKVGPVSTTFFGAVTVSSADTETRTLTLSGHGKDGSGQSQSAIVLTVQVSPDASGASVICGDAQIDVTGRLASIGGRMIPAVADVIISNFTTRLRAKLDRADRPPSSSPDTARVSEGQTQPAATSLNGGAVVWKALWNWFAKLFHRKPPMGHSERQ